MRWQGRAAITSVGAKAVGGGERLGQVVHDGHGSDAGAAGREGVDQVRVGKTADATSTVVGNGSNALQRSVATGAVEQDGRAGWSRRLRLTGEDVWEGV